MDLFDKKYTELRKAEAVTQGEIAELEKIYNTISSFIPPRLNKQCRGKLSDIQSRIPQDTIELPSLPDQIDTEDGCAKDRALMVEKKETDCEMLDISNTDIKDMRPHAMFRLTRVDGSNVTLGEIATSVYCESCDKTNLTVVCAQLRLYRCSNMCIRAKSKTGVFLEECSNIAVVDLDPTHKNTVFDFSLPSVKDC
ncbi:MAG: uncharacterized protein A8A55_1567 [Amphiamblys sp. WSBS2006]|nr:MAG: uncharacterized protein A8A55_1567 [Amphiamblys sp. WSBS2006]